MDAFQASQTGIERVQSLCHCALRAGHEVLFITHAKLLAQLHAARATNTFEHKLQQLAWMVRRGANRDRCRNLPQRPSARQKRAI